MKGKTSKLIWFLCALLAYAGCAQALSAGTQVEVLRIGKADAIIITCGVHTVLIDAGEEEDAAEILEYLAERRIAAVDAMIITHYDKDHVGGADGVLLGVRVGAVYDAAYESDTEQYAQYLAALAQTGVPRQRVREPDTLQYGRLTLRLLPAEDITDNDNDNSLVVSMDDGNHRFLFAADAEEARIDALLAADIGAHDVLKMPHHGRDKENLGALLDAVRPRVAIITDSEKHPAEDTVLAQLDARGIDTYRTMDGDIAVLSTGGGLHVMQ